jgi:Domain of unknown function (DUF6532)
LQRAHWDSKHRKIRNSEKSSGDDVIPAVELSTASEVDGRPFEDEEQEGNDNSPTDDEEDVLEGRGRMPHRGKASKRELTRRAEVIRTCQVCYISNDVILFKVPRFSRYASIMPHRPCKIEESSDDDAKDDVSYPRDVNKGWQPDSHYVPPLAGARIISIKLQPSPLQTLIRVAIREVTGSALFDTAYPSPLAINDHYRNVLIESATHLNLAALQDRLKNDHKFAEVISRVVCFLHIFCCNSMILICIQLVIRLSNLRCGLKKIAASEVKGFYHLIPGDACRERVKRLTSTTEYIFSRHPAVSYDF